VVTVALETLLISLAVILVRLAWVFPAAYLPRLMFPALRAHDPLPGWRNVFVVAWTGLRGGISLAAALALPLSIQTGRAFPERDRLIALTFGVILVTLVGQGLSLIPLIRGLSLAPDEEPEHERQQVRVIAAQAALTRLQELSEQAWVPTTFYTHLLSRYQDKARYASEQLDGVQPQQGAAISAKQRLRREIIEAERTAVIGLRDKGQIDDEVLREMERELDLEEQQA
jgi:CPA1 family monovalent cation:H+ antiporter